MDFLYLALIVVFGGATLGFAALCRRLEKP
jgi:hypothetical protein